MMQNCFKTVDMCAILNECICHSKVFQREDTYVPAYNLSHIFSNLVIKTNWYFCVDVNTITTCLH